MDEYKLIDGRLCEDQTCELVLLQTRSSSVASRQPGNSGTWGKYLKVFTLQKWKWIIPAILAILPGNESDLALCSALGALEAVVVAGLHRAPEESATRRTNLIQSVCSVDTEMKIVKEKQIPNDNMCSWWHNWLIFCLQLHSQASPISAATLCRS